MWSFLMTKLFLSHSKPLKANIVIPFLNDLSLLTFPYWFDRDVISCGEDIYTRIIEGINISSHCIAFIDDTYLHREWTLKELELFREKEIYTQSTLIIPIYCGIQKETVYKTIPWLKNRAFEKIERNIYEVGERERIVCRVINKLLDEIDVSADISILERLLVHNSVLPFYDVLYTLYNSKYYLSLDIRLSCIELCNILALLSVIYNILNIPKNSFKNSLFKLPFYIKEIALNKSDYLYYDFIVVLKRSINYAVMELLQFLNS